MPSIPCNDGLRLRALAKAKGDYEAHEVGRASFVYVMVCKEGNTDRAMWYEQCFTMFVNTTMRWKDVHFAISMSKRTTEQKQVARVRRRLGRLLTRNEKDRLRKTV